MLNLFNLIKLMLVPTSKTLKFENTNSNLIQKSSTKHSVETMNVKVYEKKQVTALQLLKTSLY